MAVSAPCIMSERWMRPDISSMSGIRLQAKHSENRSHLRPSPLYEGRIAQPSFDSINKL